METNVKSVDDRSSQARPGISPSISFEEMASVALDTMQGILMCLDQQHLIIDVSNTIKRYFGFEQTEILGLPILLLIEESERDAFRKFLTRPCQVPEIYSVRMMMGMTHDYRQVKVHRKNKYPMENSDVHSTTPNAMMIKSNGSIRTILVLTFDDSAYLDINLFDIHKQEFYTKMNLMGEILFEDHRGALITGYLPHELISHSIFNFVYHEDRLVKLHALWKCVTSSSSKLQWRFNARDGSLVFLHTEYKLISNHSQQEMIVARNELLSPSQQSQFDELQAAWRHQCAADIKGNSSSFKLIPTSEIDPTSKVQTGECRISVPSLNMCFSTNKLQSLNITGNIFEGTKTVRPLTIQDYIQILIEHEKNLDPELVQIIQSISSLSSKAKPNSNDIPMDSDPNGRPMATNAMKMPAEKTTGEMSTLAQLLQTDSSSMRSPNGTSSKNNSVPMTPESIQQQQIDFMKKYRTAKAKLESQLEMARAQEMLSGGHMNDVIKRNNILHKLSQLEQIRQKHMTRTLEFQRQYRQQQQQQQNGIVPSYPSPMETFHDPNVNRMKTSFSEEFFNPMMSNGGSNYSQPVSHHSYIDPNSLMKLDPNYPF